MRIEFRTSQRVPFTWTADVLALPAQDDLIIRDDRVFRVAKVIHVIGERDIGSRVRVVVDALRLDRDDVLG